MSCRYASPLLVACNAPNVRNLPLPAPIPTARVVPFPGRSRRNDPSVQHMKGSWLLLGFIELLALLTFRA